MTADLLTPAPEEAPAPKPVLPETVKAWLASRPRLRPVKVTMQRIEGRAAYVVENPVTGAFYRVGEAEFRFLESLDGRRSVADLLQRLAAARESAIDPSGALRLLEMLKVEGLLEGAPASTPGDEPRGVDWLDRVSGVLFWRVSLGNPDRFFEWLAGWMGWAVHPLAWLGGLLLMGVGALTILRHASRVGDATLGILAPHNWLWFGLLFIVLRVIHESWHGLTCRRLGARVRDIGVVFIVFFPVGYTDVTAGWGLPSRWHRFLVSIAGIYIEMCIAAVAALVWANTGPGMVNTLAWQTVITAGIASMVVNLNPLMRFDGYYMFTDLLDLPNLATRGQILMRTAGRRWVLGDRTREMPSLRERGWRWAAMYGPAALAWRVFVLANILAAASALFRGAGIVLVCVMLIAWSRRPAKQAWKWLRAASWGARGAVALRGAVASAALCAFLFIPVRPAVVEPGLVDWADRRDVFAGCAGVLASVEPGGRVEEGAVLAQLENPDLETDADRLRVATEREELRGRIALREEDMPGWSAARAAAEAYRDGWSHAREKASRRTVTAPAAGMVWDHRLAQRLGQQVREGELLFTVGSPVDRDVIVLVPQERYALYGLEVGDPVEVWVPGRPDVRSGRIASLGPAAVRGIDNPALTALGGGHLTVQAAGPQEALPYQMHEAQFEVRVRIEGEEARDLCAGERGYMRARRGAPIALGRLAYGGLERFWSGLLARR